MADVPTKFDLVTETDAILKHLSWFIGDLEWRAAKAIDVSKHEAEVLKYAREAQTAIGIAIGEAHKAAWSKE